MPRATDKEDMQLSMYRREERSTPSSARLLSKDPILDDQNLEIPARTFANSDSLLHEQLGDVTGRCKRCPRMAPRRTVLETSGPRSSSENPGARGCARFP